MRLKAVVDSSRAWSSSNMPEDSAADPGAENFAPASALRLIDILGRTLGTSRFVLYK